MHKDPGVAIPCATAPTAAVSGPSLGLLTAGNSVAKVFCLPLKPSSMPASLMVSFSRKVDGRWEML